MKLKKGIAFSILFLMILSVYGQYGFFSGRVLDKETGESLVGANIYVKKDMTIGVVTDFNGYFNVSVLPGEYLFTISFTGMKTQEVTVKVEEGKTTNLTIKMEPFSTQFDEVVVRAGKFDKAIEDQTVSIEVMKPRIIDAKNTRSIETILDLTPGVTILDEEPQIRGGSGFTFGVGSKVAVFIDDIPVITGDAGKPDWSLIPVENIKQIEVVKGASSVLSGSAALSGAIYVRSNYPGIKPLTKIRAYTGMYDAPRQPSSKWWDGINYLGGVNFLHTRQLGDMNTDLVIGGVFAADRSYIGAPVPGQYVENPGPELSDDDMKKWKGRLNFNLRRRSVRYKGLNYGLNGNIMYKKGSTALAWLDDTANFYRAYPGAVLKSKELTFYLDPYVNFYSTLGIKHQFLNRVLYHNSDAIANQSNRALMIYNNYQFSKSFQNIGGLDFVGGVSSNYTKSHAEMYQGSGSEDNWIWNASLYFELEKKFGNALNLSGGFRLEHFNLNDSIKNTKPIFRFGSSLKLGQETYLRASIGQGYRFPTITERYIRLSLGSFGVFNNPDLVPETSWNAEVGIKQGIKLSKFYGYVDAAIFYQEYQNTIEYLFGFWNPDYKPDIAGFKFVNTGKSKVTGIDISLTGQAKVNSNFNINCLLGYTYVLPVSLEPDYVFTQDYNPNPDKRDFSYTLTSVNPDEGILKYRFIHTIKSDLEFTFFRFSYGITFKYFSKIVNLDKAIFDFEDYTSIENTGGTLQPIYYSNYYYNHNNGNAIFDMRLSYTFHEHHKIAFIADNVFNRWYSLRPLKAEPMGSFTIQYSLDL